MTDITKRDAVLKPKPQLPPLRDLREGCIPPAPAKPDRQRADTVTDTTKLLERIRQLEAHCIDYANDLTDLEAQNDHLHRILAALRQPSEAVVKAVEEWVGYDTKNFAQNIIHAAVEAAEQEVGRE